MLRDARFVIERARRRQHALLLCNCQSEIFLMNFDSAIARVSSKAHRFLTTRFGKRIASIQLQRPVVSFTFDDAPQTAFRVGREILKGYGARATYYVSFGLLDTDTEVGRIASRNDLASALADDCELGCHTFDHLDAQHTPLDEFEASIERNRRALQAFSPGAQFTTFAYPKSGPTLGAKNAVARNFSCARGGGQKTNETATDLNLLSAVFLDRRTGIDENFIQTLIDYNAERRGWLIFATHDISRDASPFGCTPELLETVARQAKESGALILPIKESYDLLTLQ